MLFCAELRLALNESTPKQFNIQLVRLVIKASHGQVSVRGYITSWPISAKRGGVAIVMAESLD